ncbi:MAG TPA: tetratricopeptide repeat protein [Gammaproteobacteria bacterium]|nr:tetratricopeptide repeat protein [Gammaproteobacteria bacterium]HIK69932.1 tetratricopeptide repeat protein [Pseudomonadales bacterium]
MKVIGQNKVQLVLRTALQAMQRSEFAQAADKLDEVAAMLMTDVKFLGLAAEANIRSVRPEAALVFLQALGKHQPRNHEVLASLGDCLRKLGRTSEAIKYLGQSVELSPKRPEYYYNLGLCLLEMDEYSRAEIIFRSALELRSDYTKGALGLTKALEGQADWVGAERVLQSMLVDQLSNANIWFRLGRVQQRLGNSDEACKSFQKSLTLGPEGADSFVEAARCLVLLQQVGQAQAWLKAGLLKYPLDRPCARFYANLRYELGHDEFLAHYRTAESLMLSPGLLGDYLEFLAVTGDMQGADQVLSKIQDQALMDHPDVLIGRLNYLKEARDFQGMLELSVELEQEWSREWQIIAHLGLGQEHQAEPLIVSALVESPDNQFFQALLGIVLRTSDPVRYQQNFNPVELVREIDLSGHRGTGELFRLNVLVSSFLSDLHQFERNPLTQSVSGGTQSPGNLFDHSYPALTRLKNLLIEAITDELTDVAFPSSVPAKISARNTGSFEIESAWSIILRGQGHHVPHIHTKGWYSCVYYLEVPDEISSVNASVYESPAVISIASEVERSGCLAFGRPGVNLPIVPDPVHFVVPQVGKLVIFPSYIWHETMPFIASDSRVVIAFDIIPIGEK